MADLSYSFDPSDMTSDIGVNSDAASSALAKASAASVAAASASSIASDASSAAAAASNLASSALAKASDTSSKLVALERCVLLKVYDEASAISTGDGKMYFAVPNALSGANLTSAGAHLYTSGSGKTTVMIHNLGSAADMLSSHVEIDTGEKDSVNASSAAAIDTSNDGVAAGEAIRVDVDSAASGAKGLEVRLTFHK